MYSQTKNESVILYIKDNGIGIRKGEITRVFEKGFTGMNGRITNKKSTGIGLYLCKKLCYKLRLGIELNSEENVGTEVRIVFPRNSYINLMWNKMIDLITKILEIIWQWLKNMLLFNYK